jgi:hypothetical protein
VTESPGREGREEAWVADGLEVSVMCPEHFGTLMPSTGNLVLDTKFGDWYVEYRCPVDDEIFTIFSPNKQAMLRDVPKRPRG